MKQKSLAIFLIVACANYFIACSSYSTKSINRDRIESDVNLQDGSYISKMALTNGGTVELQRDNQQYDARARSITGKTVADKLVVVAVDSIRSLEFQSYSPGTVKTILLITGCVIVALAATYFIMVKNISN